MATRMVDPKSLQDSPFQPRRNYDAAALDELAESMKKQGVLQSLVARQVNSHLELVFGHRRKRAAIKAKLDEVPVEVRDYSDQTAREVQLIENLQRDDLNPLDEAEGYVELMKGSQTVEQIAASIGKSAGYVYLRLKLTDMTPEVQKLFREGKIPVTLGTYIARVPKDLQKKAAERVATKDGGEPLSFREAVGIIRKEFHVGITEAYDPEVEKRNQEEWESAVKAAGEEKPPVKVLGDTESRKAFPYGSDESDPTAAWAPVTAPCPADKGDKPKSWAKVLGKSVVEVPRAIARAPSGVTVAMIEAKPALALAKKLLKAADAPAAKGKKGKTEPAKKAAPEEVPDSDTDPEAEKLAREKKRLALRKVTTERLMARVVEKFSAKMDAARMRFLTRLALENQELSPASLKRRDKTLAQIIETLPTLAEGDARGLLVESIGQDITYVKEGYSDTAKEVAKLLNIEISKLEKDAKEELEGK